ncbi:MAG: zinc-dependent alcohol dehydrogenase family protein [Gammaproteobacteria bacterium]
MWAMVLEGRNRPLCLMQRPVPEPAPEEVLIRVHACGVCRTDLHILDGDLREPKLPLILGHEIVGTVAKTGAEVRRFAQGDRVGVPWLGYTDGSCRYCLKSQENLCEDARFTGYTIDGGYAEYAVAQQKYCFHLPGGYADAELAPLLCAGFIGYRSYRLAGEGVERIGIYGFGAAAHIIAQIALYQGKKVYAFTRAGDTEGQAFARRLGAVWAGESGEHPPEDLDAALIFAPLGSLIVDALRATAKGGVIVCGGIHMSDIPAFPYRLLWEERVIRSVANLTRRDGEELLAIAPRVPIKTEIQRFPLDEANQALTWLREGRIEGAAVLLIAQEC